MQIKCDFEGYVPPTITIARIYISVGKLIQTERPAPLSS
jgi:hypothetical protein